MRLAILIGISALMGSSCLKPALPTEAVVESAVAPAVAPSVVEAEPTCVPTLTDRVLNAHATLEGTRKVAMLTITHSLNIASQVTLKVTTDKVLMNIQSSIESMKVRPSIAQTQAKAAAEKEIASSNGMRVMEIIKPEDVKAFADTNPQFANTGCAMLLAKRQTVPFDGGMITIEYSPALPVFPNFGAPAAVIASELDEARSWSNIQATIVESTAPGFAVGEKGNMRVALTPMGDGRYKMEWGVDGVTVSKQGAFGVAPFAEFVDDSGSLSLMVYPALDGDSVIKNLEYR